MERHTNINNVLNLQIKYDVSKLHNIKYIRDLMLIVNRDRQV